MKKHRTMKVGRQPALAMLGALVLSAQVCAAQAADATYSGELSTLLRLKKEYGGESNRTLYEYLRLGAGNTLADGSTVDFQAGGWWRGELAGTGKAVDNDLQYAYVSYRGARNNSSVTLGRQFVTEGVASEHVDGVSIRSDLAAGFAAAAFAGNAVVSENTARAGSAIYGARISQGDRKKYSVGVSALRSEGNGYDNYREEAGVDLWLKPLEQLEVAGRSSYNSLTGDWMEHSYSVSASPGSGLRVTADITNINYHDYFYHMTSNAFRPLTGAGISGSETLLAVGTELSLSPAKDLGVSADYRHYGYREMGDAHYYGGKSNYAFSDTLNAGIGIHRMDGADQLRYVESSAYISKKLGNALIAANCINVWYDREINGINNATSFTGSANYDLTPRLRLGADIELSRSPYFDSETKGLLKAIYRFDGKFEGGTGEK